MFRIYSKKKDKKLLHIYYRFKINNKSINLTPSKEFLQTSIIKFKEKKIIKSHTHLKHDVQKIKRQIQESWVLIKGKAKIFYYDVDKNFLKSFSMKPGDISITFYGGHKIEIEKKNSILYEYKTGPYKGNIRDLRYF